MPWLKIDDGEGMAPWVLEVGNEAYGVHVRLRSYCAQHLTDGVVPAPIAAMIAGDVGADGASRNLAALEMVGQITRESHGGKVCIPDYLDENPSRAQVESDREATRRRQAEWREKRRRQGGGNA